MFGNGVATHRRNIVAPSFIIFPNCTSHISQPEFEEPRMGVKESRMGVKKFRMGVNRSRMEVKEFRMGVKESRMGVKGSIERIGNFLPLLHHHKLHHQISRWERPGSHGKPQGNELASEGNPKSK